MAVTRIDHLYVETADFDSAAAFWEGLGFAFVERWGAEGHRAGRLESGSAAVVLAEGAGASVTPFFALDDADATAEAIAGADEVEIADPLGPTHWGTRLMRVVDPDGGRYALEEIVPG